ncbi:MAG: Isochorismatase family protein [Alphaproteobacteria bacterium ADurb.Bin438]|nr:MAG: Isochorismatase family protein [Alphaproteobacteria bacterium ADurb.Bin438]
MLLNPEKACLVLIDMQEKIFPKMNNSKALLNNTKDLLKIASFLKIPTILTEQGSKNLGSTLYDIRDVVSSSLTVDKTTFSAYRTEAFVNILEPYKNQGRNQIIIAGIEEHVCVLQTAFDLKDNGFIPFVAVDACSSREESSITYAEKRFVMNDIEMLTNEMIAFELLKDAKNPVFKDVLKVIK